MSLKYKPSYATILFLKSQSDENLIWRQLPVYSCVRRFILLFYSFKSL